MAQEPSSKELLEAVKQQESGGRRYKADGKTLLEGPQTKYGTAKGEMQVLDMTNKDPGFGVKPARDDSPDERARVGKDYLDAMVKRYGDRDTALIAYNWGPGNTDNWLKKGGDFDKLPAETQNYVTKITGSLGSTKVAQATPKAAPVKAGVQKTAFSPVQNPMFAQLGPNYQAAFAVSMLADEGEKEGKSEDEPSESSKMLTEATARPVALASADLSYQSPFPEISTGTAGVQKQPQVQPVKMAVGGLPFAPSATVRPSAREELDAIKAQYAEYEPKAAEYNTAVEKYKTDVYNPYQAQVDAYNAALEKYKAEQFNPYQAQIDAYNAALNQYKTNVYDPHQAAVDKYNAEYAAYFATPKPVSYVMSKEFQDLVARAPVTPPEFSMAAPVAPAQFSGVAPTKPAEFSMTAPTAPAVSQAEYDAKMAAAKEDAGKRQLALNVAMDPEAYGLSMPKLFADGGEVGVPDIGDAPAKEVLARMFANKESIPGVGEAATAGINKNFEVGGGNLNIVAALSSLNREEKQELAKNLMASYTRNIGDATVIASVNKPMDIPADVYQAALMGSMPIGGGRAMLSAQGTQVNGQSYPVNRMIGYERPVGGGQLSFNASQLKDIPQSRQYQLQYRMPLGRAEGGPVYRAGGSPDTGEYFQDPMGAPSAPVTQDTLAKGKEFKAADALQAVKEVGAGGAQNLKNIARGVTETPYNFFGAAADIGNMVLTPFGLGSAEPALGSAHLKRLASEAGIRPAPPTDPRDAGFYMMGELGASIVNPADVVRKGVQAAQTTTAGVKKAADLLREMRKPKEVPQVAPAPTRGPTPEVQTELAQLNQDRQYPRAPGQEPNPLMGVRPTLEEAQTNVAARQAEPLPAPPAEVAVPPEIRETVPVAPPMQAGIPADRPFVGRLDAFIETIKNPVQLGQLKGQLKGKFRDYDLERVERAFPGMDDKTKLMPDQIKQALAGTHSPSRWISETRPPEAGKFHQGQDNVWGAPLGTTNLYLEQAPEVVAASQLFDQAAVNLGRLGPKSSYALSSDSLANARNFLAEEGITKFVPPEVVQSLGAKLDKVQPSVLDIKNKSEILRNIRQGMLYPVLYKNPEVAQGALGGQPFFRFTKEAETALQQEAIAQKIARGTDPHQAFMEVHADSNFYNQMRDKSQRVATQKVYELVSQDMQNLGIAPPEMLRSIDFNTIALPEGVSSADEILRNIPEFKLGVDDALEPAVQRIHEAEKRVRSFLSSDINAVGEALEKVRPYEGRHRAITTQPHPIGFTRFSEHEATIPGMGEVQGRHFHELQSDLSKDMRKSGTTSGNAAKDKAEYDRLNEEVRKLRQQSFPDTGEFSDVNEFTKAQKKWEAAQASKTQSMDKRISVLGTRLRENPGYSLEEPFAGFETNQMVRQQLLMKNAIQSAMRDGKRFATFPGNESAKPALYADKVQPNLKQVIKDLGGEKSGLELRQIELPPDKDGRPITATGVVWSPEAAARIMKTGVPFAKGGSVERLSADTRRYL